MQCPRCIKLNPTAITSESIIRSGRFLRKYDETYIQRYRCLICEKNFSDSTYHVRKYQKKPWVNFQVFEQLVSGTSQRRLARIAYVNRKTVVRKFVWLGQYALWSLRQGLHIRDRAIQNIVFDDMESFEHSKCKPLSMSLVVEEKTRFVLGFRVASMPAKGLLTKKAHEKYGRRKDERKTKRRELFRELQNIVVRNVTIKSDQNPHYVPDIKEMFPEAKHLAYKGRRGCVVGQGELKSGGFDPLFSLNHTAAMYRANVNRLFRRTWNTTKKAICLEWHMALYCWYHNFVLLPHNNI